MRFQDCFFIYLLLYCLNGHAQLGEDHLPGIQLNRTDAQLTIDGRLDEAAWQQSPSTSNFWQYFPSDSLPASQQTEISMLYDDNFLYIGVKCYSDSNQYVVPSLKRDYSAGGSDNITLLFDPYNDRTNAFVFGLNPYGVTREALIANGGADFRRDWDDSWDSKWYGDAMIQEKYWSAEFAIPFKTLRFKDGIDRWHFNSYRFDTQANEQSSWVRIPQNQNIINLAYMGEMVWEEPLQKPGSNVSIIPYTTGGLSADYEADGQLYSDFNIGGDAKIAITPALNLDLTINPDFSQVEVDRQVTNLNRFEIRFPERRQFFLENADLFGSFGTNRVNPFFSRRIGIATDTTTDETIENPIYYGARLSGKLDENWRIGLMNMQTADDKANDLPSFNYTVAALQRKVFTRSNVGFIFVNKQSMNNDSSETVSPYNRVAGLDYNLASSDNKWQGKFFLHRSFSPGQNLDHEWAHGVKMSYNVRKLQLEWNHRWVGEDYEAEVGFVPRKQFFRVNPEWRYFFYPTSGSLNRHGFGGEYEIFLHPEHGRTDQKIEFYWDASFRNQARMQVLYEQYYTFLLDPFDPTNTDGVELPAEQDFNYGSVRLVYSSDRRKRFAYRIEPMVGQFYNGMRYNLRGNFSYRIQPRGAISLNYNYNYIKLPAPYETASLLLIGPRIDLTFTKNIFFTTFIQYNSQIDNININARLQWRFKPVSDFFLVYTNNYNTDFAIKNQAIVAKFTYWLNL